MGYHCIDICVWLLVLLLIATYITCTIHEGEKEKGLKDRKEALQLKRDEKKLAESIKQNKNYKEFLRSLRKKFNK